MMTIDEIKELERSAEANSGHCTKCHQTIKVYRYNANKAVATFMRGMADEIRNTGTNDVDISTIGLPYSVRTQVSKIRQHGLIARIKNKDGAQIARRWLVTHKGWDFINGKPIPAKVVVYNNQVLGHEGGLVTIHGILDEAFDPKKPIYEEAPISQAEARTYDDVRKPKRKMSVRGMWRGRGNSHFTPGQSYELGIDRLQMGKPVIVNVQDNNADLTYRDIHSFQKDWQVLA